MSEANSNELLREFREQIDEIDDRLLKLLSERAGLALSIGKVKRRNNIPIHVPAREVEVLKRIAGKNAGPLPDEAIESIFRQIIRTIRKLEERSE